MGLLMPMKGIDVQKLTKEEMFAQRGW